MAERDKGSRKDLHKEVRDEGSAPGMELHQAVVHRYTGLDRE